MPGTTSPYSLASLLLFYLPLAVAAVSALYYLAVLFASLKFLFEKDPAAVFAPPVSILKPVRGLEPNFYECIASHCRQDYPQFEIIFGLNDPADPAIAAIEQLRRDYPRVPIKIVAASQIRCANLKMNSLEKMLEEAAHDIVVINDADIRVPPDYLRNVVAPLADDRVGMVTCLYRGVPAGGLPAGLEALGIGGDFTGQVLLARMVEGIKFALGATMATRKQQIVEIGGLARWSDYLADDYVLGNQIARAGYRIHLSHTVVDTLLPRRTLLDLLRQQVRQARTVRFSRPRGYPGLLLSFGIPFAVFALYARPYSAEAWTVLPVLFVARLGAAWVSGVEVAGDNFIRRFFWLLPLRDFVALGVWLASFLGKTVVWRGARYAIEPSGKIRRV
jgi:ceramide glucosyltransferase